MFLERKEPFWLRWAAWFGSGAFFSDKLYLREGTNMRGETVLVIAAFAMLSGCEWFDREALLSRRG
jgi:hypothetical protein